MHLSRFRVEEVWELSMAVYDVEGVRFQLSPNFRESQFDALHN